jgi:ketosteroid isomerase-like protein
MSDENAELVRRAYEAWNSDGLTAIEGWLADTVELHDPPQMPDSGSWYGRDAVLARLEEVAAAVGGRWVDLRDFRPHGDEVLVSMDWHVDRAPGSADLGLVFHVVRVADGKIDRLRVFLDETEALGAVESAP